MWAYVALAAAQVIGGYQQSEIIKQSADMKKSVDDMNAKFADLDAFNATAQGYSEAARYSTVADQTIAAQRSAYAGANVSLGYGTAGDVEKDSSVTKLVNTLELQRQGRAKALGYQQQALNTRLGGEMAQLQGAMDAGAAQNHGVMSAASTLVNGYERYKTSGVGNQKLSGSQTTPSYTKPGASYTDKNAPGGYGSSGHEAWFFGSNPSPHTQPTQNSSLFSDSDWKF